MNGTFSKTDLAMAAHRGVITVYFTKKDGTNRVMKCTLLPEYIQDNRQLLQEDKPARAENPDVMAVWDVEANGWRSFRIDSVTGVSYHA